MLKKNLVRFAIAGSLNTGLFYALYVLLVYIGIPYGIALAIEYGVGTVSGYFLSKYWTFSDRAATSNGFLQYSAAYVALYFLNVAVLGILVETGVFGPIGGQVVALLATISLSFLAQRYWIFSHKKVKD
ncbi:hypothetical protein LPB72_19990 [Hydrogenophaga crassostreae]|uniref:GtrA/DPMS transmembrane domain-containing protein n=1 Tax=Hydrogenophaga crassostreae TaxID=1763535 RepID=A0A162SS29_9BURK|nr:GtrA family protein [Hydrogenophaga crassostreae]AOW11767.1 hypothetical protein LPB072_01730 [Hydrogenophaga crassostreae]OAD39859.1 hypothetical protein LPB72_19990 [Hydrogenophaga crassostreae]